MAKSFSDRLLKIYGSLSELRTKLGGSTSSSDMLFWASTTLFLFLVVWSVTFEIDKSVNVEGDLSLLAGQSLFKTASRERYWNCWFRAETEFPRDRT